jgi:hypothetical protein
VATAPTGYWEDLAKDLLDPEFRRAYEAEARRIEAVDQAANVAERILEQPR